MTFRFPRRGAKTKIIFLTLYLEELSGGLLLLMRLHLCDCLTDWTLFILLILYSILILLIFYFIIPIILYCYCLLFYSFNVYFISILFIPLFMTFLCCCR
jgi:hypothetical protein